jgi:hypothetical protein
MVETPVGARCPECARISRPPTYQVPPSFMLRAIGTAFGMAIVTGIAWGFVSSFLSFVLLNLLLGAVVGYAIGEVTSLAVNRKQSTGLAVTGGIAAAGSFVMSILVPWGSPLSLSNTFSFIIDIAAALVAVYIAATRLKA